MPKVVNFNNIAQKVQDQKLRMFLRTRMDTILRSTRVQSLPRRRGRRYCLLGNLARAALRKAEEVSTGLLFHPTQSLPKSRSQDQPKALEREEKVLQQV